MTIKRLTSIFSAAAFVLLVALGAVAGKAYSNHLRVLEIQQLRVESYMLAEQNRRNLDELTRYARTFVVTGDPRFSKAYADALAVRRGHKQTGADRSIYWDFGLKSGSVPGAGSRALPFRAMTRVFAVSEKEALKLAESHARTVPLFRLEERAMAAARGLYRDAAGEYTRRGPVDREVGLKLLYGEEYLKARTRALLPIEEFISLVDARTAVFLSGSRARSLVFLRLVLGLLISILVFMAMTYRLARRRVLEPVAALQRQTEAVAADLNALAEVSKNIVKGDYDRMFAPSTAHFTAAYGDEVGELVRLHNGMVDRLRETGYAITDMTTDISRARSALGEAHAQLKSVLTAATQVSIIATDLKGVITLFNAGAEKLLGYTAKEMVGRRTPELIHLPGEVADRGLELTEQLGRPVSGFEVFVALPRGGALEQREWTYRRKDGTLVPVELIVTPVRDGANSVTGYLGVALDISERRRAGAEMRKLWRSVEASPASIMITDKDGVIEYTNPKFTSLTGYSPEEVKGKNPNVLKSGELPQEKYRELWETISAGREWRGEFHNRKKNGEMFWEAASISPIKDAAGNVTHFVAVKEDITDRRAAEAEVRAARDAAMELARLKSEFLANMSHEIRTPMNAIIGMTGLLQDTPLTPQQAEYVATVNNAGEALLDIINDILDFSKIESGKLEIERVPFPVRETVENIMELAAHRAQAAGLEIASIVDEGVPQAVKGDPGRLRQVLLNLLSNAVKFTQAGEVILTVSPERDLPGGPVLRFSVKDTGIGIAPEAQRKLFQVFSQADASTTRKYGGTGLGLAISKRLVELMSGEMGLESEPGTGSTFWFTLPLEKAEAMPEPAPAGKLDGIRVLVVDDNAASRRITGKHLERRGLRCETVSSGEAALELLRREAGGADPFRLAVLDMQMPGMDGLMLAEKMAGDPALAGVRKVMLTSLGAPPRPEETEVCGIAACLFKPVRPASLYAALGAALGDAPGQAGPAVGNGTERTEEIGISQRYFRVLVAEDNQVNQKLALMQLEKAGYKADAVGNGREALEVLARIQYDLVLMDCQMPEMDGFEATRELRRREGAGRRVPVVAMTANAMEGDREKCLAAGMDDYLPKPVRMASLLETLRKWDVAVDKSAVAGIAEAAGSGARDFLASLIEVYERDALSRLEIMRSAAGGGEAAALAEAAHALKGSSANLGLRRVESLCRRLELLGRSGSVEGVGDMLAALAAGLEAALAELRAAQVALPE